MISRASSAPARRPFGIVEIGFVGSGCELQVAREQHKERRRHHRQRHDGAEQARGLGFDEQRVGRLREEQETELAALAEQQAEA